ncbi:MAG: FAD-dependent oxidoreductase [Geminicoccaceae bacterium]|nr:FAD-dependent oxidoreductase [Geminicoccaceae bacterium]
MAGTAGRRGLKDAVLVGGGHAHVIVLRRFIEKPCPGLRLTLVSDEVEAPYSGMLPGLVAGHYAFDEAHIHLRPLAARAGARFVEARVDGLDLDAGQVRLRGRAPIAFDLLSINVGSTPGMDGVPGAREHALPVKPVPAFLARWERLLERAAGSRSPLRLLVVGGGAGGVELALSAQYALERRAGADPDLRLVTGGDAILPGHGAGARRILGRILGERGVRVETGRRVVAVEPGLARCGDGGTIPFDALFWVTGASAPAWLRRTGLALDAKGFIRVDWTLRSISDARVFAAGDVASVEGEPRPKSGVFAVRQGPLLADNLRRAARGRDLRRKVPQRRFLNLIGTGDEGAIASYAGLAVEGSWVWRLKRWIDRRFVRRFNASR